MMDNLFPILDWKHIFLITIGIASKVKTVTFILRYDE